MSYLHRTSTFRLSRLRERREALANNVAFQPPPKPSPGPGGGGTPEVATSTSGDNLPTERAGTLGRSTGDERPGVCNRYHVTGIGRCDAVKQIVVRASSQAELAAAIRQARIREVLCISELGPTIPYCRGQQGSSWEDKRNWREVKA